MTTGGMPFDLVVRNCRLENRDGLADIAISSGLIARDYADLCEIQAVIFPQEGIVRDPGTAGLMDAAMREGGDVVGGMPHWETDEQAAREHIDICLRLAQRYDADVDMHVDETDDP